MKQVKIGIVFCLLLTGCTRQEEPESWCEQPIRPEFASLQEITTSSNWFKIYLVGDGVYAIVEPYNFQEIISYLIVGNEKNILFDTGMGMSRMSEVVKELSPLPVIVINSHTHYDHIGSNHEFDTVYAIDTVYTKHSSLQGWSHQQVKQEVTKVAFCFDKLPTLDTASYYIKPYEDKIKRFIKDGDKIELGDRTIEVLQIPGHTPDGVALLDRSSGYLWTGDTYYEATIWLFFEGTDLNAYGKSIHRFAQLTNDLKVIFPAHNKPTAIPAHLIDLQLAFDSIRSGLKKSNVNNYKGHPEGESAVIFDFKYFSFLIRKDLLDQ